MQDRSRMHIEIHHRTTPQLGVGVGEGQYTLATVAPNITEASTDLPLVRCVKRTAEGYIERT